MHDILTKQDGPILRVTLNQPERGNAVWSAPPETVSGGGFDRLPGMVILELCWAQVAERGVADGRQDLLADCLKPTRISNSRFRKS
jgi:hypothetical protein